MKAKKKAKVVRIPAKYFEAVENGIKFLDLVVGRRTWLNRMDMRKFDITDPRTCVAGNVFQEAYFDGADSGYRSFCNAVIALGGNDVKIEMKLGFNAPSSKGMQYLQDIWVRKIKSLKRR